MRDPKLLSRCLVEGEEGASLRSPGRRRVSLLLSILVQMTILAALILIPLFVRGERLSPVVFIEPPIPGPRVHVRDVRKPNDPPPRGQRHVWPSDPTIRFPHAFPDHPAKIDDAGEPSSVSLPPGDFPDDGVIGAPPWLGAGDRRISIAAPPKPPEPVQPRISKLDPGQLVHRVEPVYPPLARQIRLEGTVRLRAVIGTDGAMREVEILSGHPLLVQAARDAVLQWRYKPTVLNGQPVEVETQITVVFTLRR